MLAAATIIDLHDRSTLAWHEHPACAPPAADALSRLVLDQHRANYDLWHREDEARDPEATAATIAAGKHAIDRLNQQRNDLAEQVDLVLLAQAGTQQEHAPLHSETPGMIVDRLSILSLKLYHTGEEAARTTATPEHRQRNRDRLAILRMQRDDLGACLDQLWADILRGHRRFRLYRQMKMYNDPELNPVLYARNLRTRSGD